MKVNEMANATDEKIIDLERLDHLHERLETLSGGASDETVDAIPTSDVGGNIWIAGG